MFSRFRELIREAFIHNPAAQELLKTFHDREEVWAKSIEPNSSRSVPHLTSRAKPSLEFRAPNDLSVSKKLPAKSMPHV
jgi:hypothetical protein